MLRWSFYLFVPSPLQNGLAVNEHRITLYHGNGTLHFNQPT